MRKFLLIASVAAMAVTAPAAAERGGRKGEQAQAQAEADRGGGQRTERAQARESRQQARPQRAERALQPQAQARERQQARMQRVEQRESAPRMVGRQQAAERRTRAVETRQARPQIERRARIQETRNVERARDRAVAQERVDARRLQRSRAAENQDRINRQRAGAAERQTARTLKRQERLDRRSAIQQVERDDGSRVQQLESDRRNVVAETGQRRQQLWERSAERQRAMTELRDRRLARWTQEIDDSAIRSDAFRVGQRVDRNWWYDDYVPLRYRASFDDDDRYYYRYDGDYLYRLSRNDNVVLSLFPVLGGAYSVGRPMPYYYDSFYNVPLGYSSLYYDSPSSYYRYGDGAIYGINPTTQLITGIVALLTGQNFGIGQTLPMGYDVYNVPYAYRSSYYDTPDMWWRYDDGYLYGVDPYSRMIERRVPVYGGYMVGNEWPSYAGYGYDVPDYYDDLYYDAPGYDYRYASGGIYQVDPATQLIAALAALVTGQNFNAGQRLPLGYDAYNVPFAYRDQYYDTDRYMYRYADGRILQVDPGTRVIRRVILV